LLQESDVDDETLTLLVVSASSSEYELEEILDIAEQINNSDSDLDLWTALPLVV
jgi:hypothetical protein